MKNFEKIKYPKTPTTATHYTSKSTKFFAGSVAPSGTVVTGIKKINGGTNVIVLEDSVGYLNAWHKVLIQDSNGVFNVEGYVLREDVSGLSGTKEFAVSSKNVVYNPDANAKDVAWRHQKKNIPFSDDKRGLYAVVYDTNVEKVDNNLDQILEESLIKGLSLILQEHGKKYDEKYIKSLLDQYYMFGQVEGIDYSFRTCSTLMAYVTVSKKYIEALEGRQEFKTADQTWWNDLPSNMFPLPENAPTPPYKLTFSSYEEYKKFFDDLELTLAGISTVYKNRKWIITPEGIGFNPAGELETVKNFRVKVDELIVKNVPIGTQGAFVQTREDGTVIFRGHWIGSITFNFFNSEKKDEIQLASVEYKTSNGEKIPMNSGMLSFLNDDTIRSKTLLNYIVQKNNLKKDFEFKWGGSTNTTDNYATEYFSKFVTENHFPVITSIEPEPLDVINCVVSNYQLAENITKNKIISNINKFQNYKKQDIDKQIDNESSEIIKFFSSVETLDILPSNFRKVFFIQNVFAGKEKPEELRRALGEYISALQQTNIAAILLELANCAIRKIPPEELNKLLQEYNKAKQNLENFAFATVCNPFVTEGLKKINSVQLPTIPTYDPNKKLVDALERWFIKLIQDTIVLTMRELLKFMIRLCSSDGDKEQNAGDTSGADSLLNNLNNTQDNNALNDAIGNIFGITDDAQILAQRQELIGLIDDLTCLLTTKEICILLKGDKVEDEVYEIILKSIASKKPNLKNKISTNSDVARLFTLLGNNLPNLAFCNDNLIEQADSALLCGCNEKTLLAARRTILEAKGLPNEALDAILNDIKDEELKNVEELLKFLDSDEPFDLNNIPSVLCANSSDNNSPPPLTPPIASFKSSLDAMLKSTYESFEKEAAVWPRTAFSVSSSNFSMLSFDSDSGKIVINKPPQNDSGVATASQEIHPAYLFNNILQNNSYNAHYNKFNVFIDGQKQQVLDINLIDQALRDEIEKANIELTNFISDFLPLLYGGAILKISSPDIFRFLPILDNFARYSKGKPTEERTLDQIKKLIGDKTPDIEFFNQNEISVYLTIMQFFTEKQVQFNSLMREVDVSVGKVRAQAFQAKLEQCLRTYKNVIKYYNTVFNCSIQYPNYKVTYTDNVLEQVTPPFDTLGIEDSLSETKESKLPKKDVYEKFNLNITRNGLPYLTIDDRSVLSSSIDPDIQTYISDVLGIKEENPSKSLVFEKFIYHVNNEASIATNSPSYIDSSPTIIDKVVSEKISTKISEYLVDYNYNYFSDDFMKYTIDSVKDSEFLKKVAYKTDGNTSYKAKTDFLVLNYQQTDRQKVCNIKPNYLDIDDVKTQAVNNKQKSSCIDQIIMQSVADNKPVNTDELEKLETSDTQNVFLGAIHKIALRMYLHDIVLRGIGVFGYYDPQILRDDPLFVDFITDMLEIELKATDELYFNILTGFLVKLYKIDNPDSTVDTNSSIFKRELLKNTVRFELKSQVLPKLAKRILDDTNAVLETIDGTKIKLRRFDDLESILDNLNIFTDETVKSEIASLNESVDKIKFINNSYIDDISHNNTRFQEIITISYWKRKELNNKSIDDLDKLSNDEQQESLKQIKKILIDKSEDKKSIPSDLKENGSSSLTALFDQFIEIYTDYYKYSKTDTFKNSQINIDIKNPRDFFIENKMRQYKYPNNDSLYLKTYNIDKLIILLKELFKIINIVKVQIQNFIDKLEQKQKERRAGFGGIYLQGFTFSINNNGHICINKFDSYPGMGETYSYELYKIYKGNLSNFSNSIEYKLLFEYLFPLKRYVTLAFITNVLCTQTRKQVTEVFNDTKASLRKLAKIVQTNGQPLTPDVNNPQEVKNDDPWSIIGSFIMKQLTETPKLIAKGYIETTDPNVALSSGIYKIAKTFSQDVSSATIPLVGIPLAIAGSIPGSFLMPFGFNLYNSLYYATGMWYEEPKKNTIDAAIGQTQENCTDTTNPDELKVDTEGYYTALYSIFI